MATKKQKREQGAARQELFAKQSILSGLKAQEKDRDRRAKKETEAQLQKRMEAHKAAVANIKTGLPFGEGDAGGCN